MGVNMCLYFFGVGLCLGHLVLPEGDLRQPRTGFDAGGCLPQVAAMLEGGLECRLRARVIAGLFPRLCEIIQGAGLIAAGTNLLKLLDSRFEVRFPRLSLTDA